MDQSAPQTGSNNQQTLMQDVMPPATVIKSSTQTTPTATPEQTSTQIAQKTKKRPKHGGIFGLILLSLGFMSVVAQTTFIVLSGEQSSKQNIVILCAALGVLLFGCLIWIIGRSRVRR